VRSVTANTRGDATDFLTLAERLRIKVTTTGYPFDQAGQALADLLATGCTAPPFCRYER
jgi:alcohol dehydrogenase, propanol-preferring